MEFSSFSLSKEVISKVVGASSSTLWFFSRIFIYQLSNYEYTILSRQHGVT
jgi:hypothetical protein